MDSSPGLSWSNLDNGTLTILLSIPTHLILQRLQVVHVVLHGHPFVVHLGPQLDEPPLEVFLPLPGLLQLRGQPLVLFGQLPDQSGAFSLAGTMVELGLTEARPDLVEVALERLQVVHVVLHGHPFVVHLGPQLDEPPLEVFLPLPGLLQLRGQPLVLFGQLPDQSGAFSLAGTMVELGLTEARPDLVEVALEVRYSLLVLLLHNLDLQFEAIFVLLQLLQRKGPIEIAPNKMKAAPTKAEVASTGNITFAMEVWRPDFAVEIPICDAVCPVAINYLFDPDQARFQANLMKINGPQPTENAQLPVESVSWIPTIVMGECPPIVSRAEWGARAPGSTTYLGDGVPYMFIHHSAGASCSSKSECIQEVKGIQNYHMDSNGWSDIGYSFLIGGDGNVYEGRGWNKVGAHTYGFNSVGYGIDFIGTFTSTNPTQAAQDAYLQLAECGVALGHVAGSFELKGHRQTGSTECPGNTFYITIQNFPHWTDGNIGKHQHMDQKTKNKLMEV
eukprot:maker-scaffold209_size256900-snap-gene-1.26 protein:Tk05663 transcript:maker-scaffold209_size256900-snap-gene-1.26-mRNA-1 annotation:"peptidoglycan recognition protein"